MKKIFYVIVDLHDLTYMRNGASANIEDADKFETLKDAKNELAEYDDGFNGAIYQVIESIDRTIEKVDY